MPTRRTATIEGNLSNRGCDGWSTIIEKDPPKMCYVTDGLYGPKVLVLVLRSTEQGRRVLDVKATMGQALVMADGRRRLSKAVVGNILTFDWPADSS